MTVSLSAQNIVKRYGGVVALSDGSLDVQAGEVVALIGANGSGKSTMSKIINGVVVLDGGQLLLDGKPVHFSSPQAARRMGISTVFQELSLIPQMTVAENIWLSREPLRPSGVIDFKEVRRRTEQLLDLFKGTYKSNLTADIPVSALSPDEKQIIEILKAISNNPRILILDEATASLDSRQVTRLFELVKQWKEEGKAIVFVSHRMEEIFRIADRYMVLRNGKSVGSGLMKEISEKELVGLMIEKASVFNHARNNRATHADLEKKPVFLEAQCISTDVLKGVSLSVKQGELLGLGGLMGQGQRELMRAIYGDIPFEGKFRIQDKPVHYTHPKQAMKANIAYVPGDRAREGLLYIRSILENIMLPSWREYGFPLRMARSQRDAAEVGESLSLKMAGLSEPVSSLSGGNAQKVVIGKWLKRKPQLLLLDDPTKGVDVGTKAEFYRLLTKLCEEGKTIIFYSSDDEELVGLCDRIVVMYDGTIKTELTDDRICKENLISASLGSSNGREA